MHQLPCSHCGESVSVTPSKAGQEIDCPACQQVIMVPKLGDLRRLSPATQSETTDGSGGGGKGATLGFGVCALIATGCLVVAAYSGIRWYLIDVPTTTEDHIISLTQGYAEAAAAELIREYEGMEEIDIELATPFGYQVTSNLKQEWGQSALMSLGAGILGILGAVFFLFRSNR